MAVITDDIDIKRDLCTALGLDATKVSSIQIRIVPDEVVKLEIVKYLTKHESDRLCKVLSTCKLIQEREIDVTTKDEVQPRPTAGRDPLFRFPFAGRHPRVQDR